MPLIFQVKVVMSYSIRGIINCNEIVVDNFKQQS